MLNSSDHKKRKWSAYFPLSCTMLHSLIGNRPCARGQDLCVTQAQATSLFLSSPTQAPGICPFLLSCSVGIITQTKLYIYPGSEEVIRGPKAYLQLSKWKKK